MHLFAICSNNSYITFPKSVFDCFLSCHLVTRMPFRRFDTFIITEFWPYMNPILKLMISTMGSILLLRVNQ